MEERLNFTGGLRYEHAEARDKSVGDEDFASYAYFSSQGLTDRSQLPTKRSFDHLSPSLGASYMATDWLKLRANYTQGWRAPSGRQLFASKNTEGYGAGGDPRLKPEKTHSYEAGFDVNVKDFNFSATYFFNDVKNFIYLYFYPQSSGRVMRNVGQRYQAGFEIQTSANLAGLMGYDSFELRPYVGLTHMTKREERIKAGGQGLDDLWWPITRMPDTVMNYGLKFTHFASHFSANLSFNYSGSRLPGRGNATLDPLNHYSVIEFGKINVANLSLSKRLWEFPDDSNVVLKVNVNNIFDKVYSYRDKVGHGANDTYPYPGRNFYATLSYNF